ncbi:MAG TPA: MSMEG_1061 family FMN-dependent PPOX-type flavoprotein [Solirubrobacteraceae bacterium]|nr:MSMEG_1061 family FMN-dependent PPOX-type flavoprotein [Solirubrobacteraceae bacterium]
MDDPFERALSDASQLAALYGAPGEPALRKDVGLLDVMCARLIAASPMVMIASSAANGRCDVTPRGGPPGFVTVLDERRLAIPDATGNRRLDTLHNIVATGRAGLLFVIPGRGATLRVNGRACVSADEQLLASLPAVGKAPRTAIVVDPEEVYAHCPKAFIRSGLWDPRTWPDADELPSPAEVSLAHLRDPSLALADVERQQAESIRDRLA